MAPDYADNVKFADEWLPAQPGTDGALAMAMGHVDPQGVLRRPAGRLLHRLRKRYTDLPFLVTLDATADGADTAGQVPHRRRPAADGTTRTPRSRPSCWTRHRRTGRAERLARVPLRRGGRRAGGTSTSATVDPLLSAAGGGDAGRGGAAALRHPGRRRRHDAPRRPGPPRRRTPRHDGVRPAAGPVRRGPRRPARRLADAATTTRTQPYTPAWQAPITGGAGAQPPRGSPGSSPPTPRSPAAGR